MGVMMNLVGTKQRGFTIVELLIVIVVIGILAAITIVAFNGVQNRANDAAVQSDLRNAGIKVNEYIATNGSNPDNTQFYGLGIKVTRNAYGSHYIPSSTTNEYNFLYCRDTADTQRFLILAGTKSGKYFVYRDGSVRDGVGPLSTHTASCQNNGITTTATSWGYNAGTWNSGL